MGSFSIWHWLIVLVIILLVFGTKKLRNIGQDLGGAVKGFKDGIREGDQAANKAADPAAAGAPATPVAPQQVANGQTIEGEIKEKTRS